MAERSASDLKPLLEIFEPDLRTAGTADPATQSVSLAEYHQIISQMGLSENVPHEIQTHFGTAKNCLLYGWFSYRLGMLAAFHAIATVEMVLRRYCGNANMKENTLNVLLERAHDQGLVNFKDIDQSIELENFVVAIRDLRNELAHGSHMLITTNEVLGYMNICAGILNQLYASVENKRLKPVLLEWI
jgi:hypothetical protein